MPVTLSSVSKHITKAKLMAKGWMPYLSHVLSSMRTYVGHDVRTMAVDECGRLYVNEDWVQTLSVQEAAYVLLHEVLHVVLSHAKRRKSAIPDPNQDQAFFWNVAADLCIQQMLARHHRSYEPAEGVKINGEINGVRFLSIPGLKAGMTTEAYYGLLWSYFSSLPKQPQPEPQGGGGGGQGDEQDAGQPGQQDGEKQQDKQGGGDGPTKALDPSQCGSGSDGIKRDYEKPTRLAEQALMESKLAEVEKRIEEHEASSPGTVPGELKQSIQARLHPAPDPFDQLRGIVARSVASPIGADEATYRRMNRRQPHGSARLRGIVRMAPECSVILDTSGSMTCGNTQERAINAVAQGLRKVQRPRVVQFDTRAVDARRLDSMKHFQWQGGGGTDMAAAIEQEDREQRPDAIVLITDGETDWPDRQPRARVIVALCRRSSYEGHIPKWARIVRCYEEGPKYAG